MSTHSIQDRLRNIAKSSGRDFQLVLTRYFQERLLFRLSRSRYKEDFCLKGGALLYALDKEMSRPTLDIDLLSLKIKRDVEKFASIFREICELPVSADGLEFESKYRAHS